jgi:hypothetical protein
MSYLSCLIAGLKDGAPFQAGLCSVERAVSSVALQRCPPLYGEDCGDKCTVFV